MNRTALCVASWLALAAVAGCPRTPPSTPVAPPPALEPAAPTEEPKPVEEMEEALQAHIESILAATDGGDVGAVQSACEALALPDHGAWFADVFGADVGAKLAADYGEEVEGVGAALVEVFRDAVAEGKLEVRVTKYTSSDDPEATGAQREALAAMRMPVALYSVRMVRPGEPAGTHVWSFVYVDGAFRLAGKMKL